MIRKQLVLAGLLVFLSGLALANPASLPTAHATLTGLVCLQDPSSPAVGTANPCPSTSPTLDGPAAGTGQISPTQIRVGVYINASDAMTGFDVSLVADSTILKPAGVDFTGTVLPGSTTIVVECLSNVSLTGGKCAPTDNMNTLHFAMVAGFGSITTAPTTGLLFVAIYNITGTVTSGIAVGFQTGCSGTSDSPFCVTIANAANGTTPDNENIRSASFNNHTPPPWVAISSNGTSLNFVNGSGTGSHVSVVATAKNGWPGVSTDLVSFSIRSSQTGIVASFAPGSCSTVGASCSTVMSLFGVAGNYTIAIQGKYVLTDSNFGGQSDTLIGPVSLSVVIHDFSFTLSPSSLSITTAASATSSVSLSSLNGFAGTVTLQVRCVSFVPVGSAGAGGSRYYTMAPLYTCPFASLTQMNFTLSKGTSGSSTLNIPSQSGPGTYSILVVAYSSSVNHFATLHLVISDFIASVPSTSLFVDVGSSVTSTISLTSLVSFAGSVSLSASAMPSGLALSFTSSSVTLTAGGSGSSVLTILAPSGTATGNYNVTVTMTGNGVTHTIILHLLVHPTGFLYPLASLIFRESSPLIVSGGILAILLSTVMLVVIRRPTSEYARFRKRDRGNRVGPLLRQPTARVALSSLGGPMIVIPSSIQRDCS